MRDAAFIVDTEGRIKYLNEAAKALLQGGIADYIDEFLSAIPPISDDEQFLAKYRQALSAGKRVHFLQNFMHRRWYDVSVQPADGNCLIFFHDVTVRHIMDERFRFTHFSINQIRDAIFWVRPGGSILSANPAASELLGYPRDRLMKIAFPYIVRYIPSVGWQGFWDLVKKNESIVLESPVSRSDGDTRPAEISASYIKYHDQELMVVIIRDISERKQIEQAVLKTREQAESAKEQAELYLDLMGHDINNMNQIALGYLELAMEAIDMDAEQRVLLEKPMQTMQKTSRLIENVRKLQRAREGKVPVSIVCLGELLDKMITHYNYPPGRHIGIDLVQNKTCKVIANDLLEDVFNNLIGNAVKHNEGDLAIGIVVDKLIEGEKGFCVVAISDNGHGIPDLQKQNLFSRGQNEKYRASGSGLGLHLVKTLVESYGGKIRVEDRVPGDWTKGARFVVMIPSVE